MNYRHIFHAGNFADVTKHVILTLLLRHLRSKEAGFCVLDTHAGIGRYDLTTEPAQATQEYTAGIGRLFGRPCPHLALEPLLALVATLNRDGALRWYPGSPLIARDSLRPQDRLIAVELHPDDARSLKREFAGDRHVAVHHMDGYQALKAHLPPKEKRGLILIDPPFENRDEHAALVEAIRGACGRFSTGCYAIWYPIKERAAIWRFHEALAATGIRKILIAELTTTDEQDWSRFNGSGMALINPPWQLDQDLPAILAALHQSLAANAGGAKVAWLVPE
ncbi:MAG: 23S rRNA (adenine(2030)-N(6))-methyltransferase RlmJ [Azospirillaceae bacterium]|nr:23S rRNA (adenine(2030)-N(6))-methyltransferase RlmJ [Azospirillaceae bacterium]